MVAPAPAEGASVIGSYAKGCLAGGTALPLDGPAWQAMRLSRNRVWGHPDLVAFIERLAIGAQGDGWPGLLVGDMAQPRGGPMRTGHASHQIGLDVDLWLTPMPDRRLSGEERESISAVSMLKPGTRTVDEALFTDARIALIRRASLDPEVARIFVHPAIKQAMCDRAAGDRAWLTKIRPWWGHDAHFHVRLACPPGETPVPRPGPAGTGRRLRRGSGVVVHRGAVAAEAARARPPHRCGWPTCPPPARPCSDHVEQIEQDDHRDRDADRPQQNATHDDYPRARPWPMRNQHGDGTGGSGPGQAWGRCGDGATSRSSRLSWPVHTGVRLRFDRIKRGGWRVCLRQTKAVRGGRPDRHDTVGGQLGGGGRCRGCRDGSAAQRVLDTDLGPQARTAALHQRAQRVVAGRIAEAAVAATGRNGRPWCARASGAGLGRTHAIGERDSRVAPVCLLLQHEDRSSSVIERQHPLQRLAGENDQAAPEMPRPAGRAGQDRCQQVSAFRRREMSAARQNRARAMRMILRILLLNARNKS